MNLTESTRIPPKPLVSIRAGYVVMGIGCAIATLFFLYALAEWRADDALLGASIGLMIAATLVLLGAGCFLGLSRRQAAAYVHRLAHADAPWTWRPEWRKSAICADNGTGLLKLWVGALAWNTVSCIVIYSAWSHNDDESLFLALLFMAGVLLLIGVVLLSSALRLQSQRLQFGIPRFVAATLPGEIGGQLRGTIEIPARIQLLEDEEITLVLRCVSLETSADGDYSRTTETTVWETTQRLPAVVVSRGDRRTSLPVQFDIPCGLPESSWIDPSTLNMRKWQLLASVSSRALATKFDTTFTVPVFVIPSVCR